LKLSSLRAQLLTLLLLSISLTAADKTTTPTVCDECIKKNLDYLAGPELHGRGSGTEDEHHAAQYIAEQLKSYGAKPAAENGQYIQTGSISTRKVTGTPTVTYTKASAPVTLTQGKELALFAVTQPDVTGPLQKLDLNDASATAASIKPGAVVLLKLKPGSNLENLVAPLISSKAAVVIIPVMPEREKRFEQVMKGGPRPERKIFDEPSGPNAMLMAQQAADAMWSMADGTPIKFHADMTPWETTHTWNVLAKIDGKNAQQVILLSAHLDHLGVHDGKTYPGADDDASGTVAVMELARALGKEPQPQRTVVFALFGSEEAGLIGARYFLKHPTFPLKDIVANLNFEMIGRADPKVKPNELWLTGWERTNLGPELAKQGAQLVGDPHPDQNFFQRSDNYALARDGIIAQTVSSYGLHTDYHQPTDSVDKIDWTHIDNAVGSMIAPVTWLANTDFTPQWTAGGKP
jgi:Peptidase family M28